MYSLFKCHSIRVVGIVMNMIYVKVGICFILESRVT